MNTDTIIKDFPVAVYGNLEKYNDVISKGRCRIFYKGANRNGTFITDEFAEKLLSTIAYAPVKGIFESEEDDFLDHGDNRTEGRIYGIVPADYNLAWEKHEDEDGVEREYACVDVLLYTALYTEANTIFGKSQSMELYRKSIKGDWQIIDGKQYYVFEDACFLGLQVLGDKVEPCFEGASFFSLYESLLNQVEELDQLQNNFQNNKQGGNTMPSITFRLSDSEKFDCLMKLINADCSEDSWYLDYGICAVYDDYAIVMKYADSTYERVYYIKDDETNSLKITERVPCYIIDVTESEKKALDAVREMNNNTYDLVDEKIASIDGLNSKISENDTKVAELNELISTLTMERDESNAAKATIQSMLDETLGKYSVLEKAMEELKTERDALAAYKYNVEDEAKKAIIQSYANSVSADIIEQYTMNRENLTAEELDMKLTYEQKKAHPEFFTQGNKPAYIPKNNSHEVGLEEILARYENK